MWLRTISQARRHTCLSAVVEDYTGVVDLLSLHNINIQLDDDVFLPKGSYLAIRSPYYKLETTGKHTICVDHPSDLVKLSKTDHLVTQFKWTDHDSGSSDSKPNLGATNKEAENLFHRRAYHAAIEKYGEVINNPELVRGSAVWAMAYFKRAFVRLSLSQYDDAIYECEGVLRVEPSNPFAFVTKAQALHALRRYDEAQELSQQLASFARTGPAGPWLAQYISDSSTKCALESKTGRFDFSKMQGEASARKHPRLDHGDFIGPVEVRPCFPESKGRGSFATRDIRQGELLLCEKAFIIGYDGESNTGPHAIHNTVSGRFVDGPGSWLVPKLVQLLHDNRLLASRFFTLYSGVHTPSSTVPITPEGVPIIDFFTVFSILNYNGFSTDSNKFSPKKGSAKEQQSDSPGIGLWHNASFFNHSCAANTAHTFIGDFIILRALRSIKAGAELTITYVPPLRPVAAKDRTLSKLGFKCQCEVCSCQRAASKEELSARAWIMEGLSTFVSSSLTQPPAVTRAFLVESRRLFNTLLATHANPRYFRRHRRSLRTPLQRRVPARR